MRPTRKLSITLVAVALSMLAGLALTSAPAEAHEGHHHHQVVYVSTPCPNWSIQDVLDDPDSDWDRDRLSNVDEVYVAGGLSPCKYDSDNFCDQQPQYCYDYVSTTAYNCASGLWSWTAAVADTTTDWDGDGIANRYEALAGADPCSKPCPSPSSADISLSKHLDWDNDGHTNSTEAAYGSDPCNSHSRPLIQHYPQAQRLPHVVVYPQPKVIAVAPVCPVGYPYYHPGTGLCYANPVKAWH